MVTCVKSKINPTIHMGIKFILLHVPFPIIALQLISRPVRYWYKTYRFGDFIVRHTRSIFCVHLFVHGSAMKNRKIGLDVFNSLLTSQQLLT